MAMRIEPMGSIPTPLSLIAAGQRFQSGRISQAELRLHYDFAVQVIVRFEATGSKVVADGDQAKESLDIYPIDGLTNIAANGIPVPFADGRSALCLLTTVTADPG